MKWFLYLAEIIFVLCSLKWMHWCNTFCNLVISFAYDDVTCFTWSNWNRKTMESACIYSGWSFLQLGVLQKTRHLYAITYAILYRKFPMVSICFKCLPISVQAKWEQILLLPMHLWDNNKVHILREFQVHYVCAASSSTSFQGHYVCTVSSSTSSSRVTVCMPSLVIPWVPGSLCVYHLY